MSQITTTVPLSYFKGPKGMRARHRKARAPYDKSHSIAVFEHEMRAVEAKSGCTETFTSQWFNKSTAYYEKRPGGLQTLELDATDGRGKLAKRYRNVFLQMLPKCWADGTPLSYPRDYNALNTLGFDFKGFCYAARIGGSSMERIHHDNGCMDIAQLSWFCTPSPTMVQESTVDPRAVFTPETMKRAEQEYTEKWMGKLRLENPDMFGMAAAKEHREPFEDLLDDALAQLKLAGGPASAEDFAKVAVAADSAKGAYEWCTLRSREFAAVGALDMSQFCDLVAGEVSILASQIPGPKTVYNPGNGACLLMAITDAHNLVFGTHLAWPELLDDGCSWLDTPSFMQVR